MRETLTQITCLLGIVGALGQILRAILFLIDPFLVIDNLDDDAYRNFLYIPIILVHLGYIGLAVWSPKWREILLGVFALRLIFFVYLLLNPYQSIDDLLYEITFIVAIITIGVMFYYFGQANKFAFIVMVTALLRIPNFDDLDLNLSIIIVYFSTLLIWFGLVLSSPEMLSKLTETREAPIKVQQAPLTSTSQTMTQTSQASLKNRSATPLTQSTFVAQLLFWCENCNKQKQGVKVDLSSSESLQQKRMCPDCNNTLLQFWAPITKPQDNKMVNGVSLFMSGIIMNIVNSAFFLGVIPLVLGLIVMIIGLAIAWPAYQDIRSVDRPPSYATPIPDIAVWEDQKSNMIRFATAMGVRSILVFLGILIISLLIA